LDCEEAFETNGDVLFYLRSRKWFNVNLFC